MLTGLRSGTLEAADGHFVVDKERDVPPGTRADAKGPSAGPHVLLARHGPESKSGVEIASGERNWPESGGKTQDSEDG